MSKIITLLLLLSFTFIEAQDLSEPGYLGLSGYTMEYDKQKHALGGIGLGFVSYIYFETQDNNTELDAYFKSSAFVLGISLLKESNDKWLGGREFSVDDIGATMLGHFMGATTAYLLRKRAKRRALKKRIKITTTISFNR